MGCVSHKLAAVGDAQRPQRVRDQRGGSGCTEASAAGDRLSPASPQSHYLTRTNHVFHWTLSNTAANLRISQFLPLREQPGAQAGSNEVHLLTSTVLQYSFEVLVLHLNVSTVFLREMLWFLLHFMYLTALVNLQMLVLKIQ